MYRRDDLTGLLPFGQIQSLALPSIAYDMGFTPGLLSSKFQKSTPSMPATNLIPDPKSLLGGIGVSQGGYVDVVGDGSWWKQSNTISYSTDPSASPTQELSSARNSFYTPKSFIGPFKNATSVQYDGYSILPIRVTNPAGNAITSVQDYRTLEPKLVISPNGNRKAIAFDAMGLVVAMALTGKTTESVGDSLDNLNPGLFQENVDQFFASPTPEAAAALLGGATSRMIYDYSRYWRDPTQTWPIYTASITRETHTSDPKPTGAPKVQIKFTYSDGFGRSIQTKDYTNPGPLTDQGSDVNNNRWVGSGWTVFNNKGMPARKYENFFDDTHQFKYGIKVGVSPLTIYDPVGRVVVVLHPDHSLEKTVVIDAWSLATYDVNDNVLIPNPKNDPVVGHYFDTLPDREYLPSWYDVRSVGQLGTVERDATAKAAAHADTPSISHIDPMGREILHLDDNEAEKFATHFSIDIQGKQRGVRDSKGRAALLLTYSMTENLIHRASMDAGEEWTLTDVTAKQIVAKWNSRGFRFRYAHDSLRRPTETWLRDGIADEILLERITYGELAPNATAHNLLEQVWKSEDQAGVLIQDDFDFKGNLLSKSHQLCASYKNVLDLSKPVTLESEAYPTTVTYDALSRLVSTANPDRSVTYRIYNESQHLNKAFINVKGEQDPASDPTTWTPILQSVEYNARGQITKVSYGNGTTTSRTYDPFRFRLQRVQTLDASNLPLQDLNYTCNPYRNVTYLRDNAQQTIFFRNSRVDPSCDFRYDPTYKLINASGREHLGQTNGRPNSPTPYDPWDSLTSRLDSPGDGNAVGLYTEAYAYDSVGNILTIQHSSSDPSSGGGGWTRRYSYNELSLLEPGNTGNRLSSTAVGSTVETYKYDGNAGLTGNMTRMPHLSLMQWNPRMGFKQHRSRP
jgi:YD repeat-containing protein